MEELALLPAALDSLKVATTAMPPADPEYHTFREWCDWLVEKRSAALLNQQNLTAILYLNTNLDFQVISMIGEPANRPQREGWCIGQFGTRLRRGPDPI